MAHLCRPSQEGQKEQAGKETAEGGTKTRKEGKETIEEREEIKRKGV